MVKVSIMEYIPTKPARAGGGGTRREKREDY